MIDLKILKKLFTNPIIFGLIALVCTYIYFAVEREQQKIAKGYSALACADSSQKVITTLRDILKQEDPVRYLLLARGSTNHVEFPARGIPNYTLVKVIDTLESHPEIVQIYIHRENPTSVNPRNEYLWIWEGYICR